MAIFTQENAPIWQGLFNAVAQEKPALGRTIRVTRGKHTGRVGAVKRHQESQYVNAFRYGDSAQHAMTQARGRYGFCILVETADGERFWCNADYAMVCVD
jgi:ribosomal protein S4E